MMENFRAIGMDLLTESWKYARTMPRNPHWYTQRKHWANRTHFDRAVVAIREHGYPLRFGRTTYTCFNINGWRYWTMGAPVNITILINRAKNKPAPAAYDRMAPFYDAAFEDPESVTETVAAMGLLGDLSGLKVLDIGCGTGTLLDYHTPGTYVGIDPSSAMLRELVVKHPDRADDVIACPFESYMGAGFDVVVAMFGAPSYIEAAAVASIPGFLRRRGRYVAMFCRPDYTPVAYERTGVTVPMLGTMADCLNGSRITIGNFDVVVGKRP